MRRLKAAAKSDQGRVRHRNEDAYCVGENVYAVADGMGGHLAGDVASATALMPIEGLNGRVFSDAASAQAALLDAILAANAAVVRKAANEPELHGMGTTLTATIVEGRRMHVGHVGDSRAYLMRGGEFVQLTRDHTLVAHLIEQGRLTAEEAASHPQRSIVTRAIGVDVDLEVDTMTIELEDGDQVLLCSDGLTGPVDDETISEILDAGDDIDETVDALIDRANENGGPDNITVVLLRYNEENGRRTGRLPATVIRPDRTDRDQASDWAEKVGRLGSSRIGTGKPRRQGEDTSGSGRWQRVAAIALALVVLLGLAGAGTRWMLSRMFFVGLDGGEVAIFNGVPASAGPVEFYWVAEDTDLTSADVADFYVPQLEEGIAAADLADARQIVASAPRGSPTPSPSPNPTATVTNPPTGGPEPSPAPGGNAPTP